VSDRRLLKVCLSRLVVARAPSYLCASIYPTLVVWLDDVAEEESAGATAKEPAQSRRQSEQHSGR
jgi:hypothetical protein